MKTAFRRELEAAGWRALGFLLGLAALAIGTVIWGHHIEGRIDSVIDQRQHDHRVLRQLVHDARPVARPGEIGGVPSERHEGGHPQGQNQPPNSTQPASHPESAPQPGGHSPGHEHGHESPSPAPSPSPTSPVVTPSPSPLSTPEQPQGGGEAPVLTPHESALESVGATLGEVVEGTGGAVDQAGCEVGGLLGGRCP